jgi:hypothetical protein
MEILLIIALLLALVLAPYVLIYRYLEKKDWMTALKGGALFALLKVGAGALIGLLLVGTTLGLLMSILIDVAYFALAVFVMNRYFKKYAIKRPVAFFIWLFVSGLVLAAIIVILGLAALGLYGLSAMSLLPIGGI